MKFFIAALFLLLSHFAYSKSLDKSLSKVMNDYLVAMKSKDEKALVKVVSPKYLKFLKDSKLLESSFKKQTPGKVGEFDFTFKPFAKEKDAYFVNIKNKTDKFYSDYWFVIKKTKAGLRVDSSVFLD